MPGHLAPRRVLLAGATGLVGGHILRALLADPTVSDIHVLSRRPLAEADSNVQVHLVDFSRLPALPGVDEVYLALGTTIRVAGSEQAFRAVDLDANLAVATQAAAGGHRSRLLAAGAARRRQRCAVRGTGLDPGRGGSDAYVDRMNVAANASSRAGIQSQYNRHDRCRHHAGDPRLNFSGQPCLDI